MSHGMAAKLAAGRFPSAEFLRGAGQAGVQAKRVQEPLRRNAHHVSAVVVRGLLARAGEETHLRHGIRRRAQFGVLPREDESLGERRRLDRLRPSAGSRRNLRGARRGGSRRGCRLLSESCSRTRDCGCKEPPGQFRLVVHMDPTAVILARLAGALPGPRTRMPARSAGAGAGNTLQSPNSCFLRFRERNTADGIAARGVSQLQTSSWKCAAGARSWTKRPRQ